MELVKNNDMINFLNNNDNNIKKDPKFKTEIINSNFNEEKFEELYLLNTDDNLYYCKFCKNKKGIKTKFSMERHIREKHFTKKIRCNICGLEVIRFNDHIKSKNHIEKSSKVNLFNNNPKNKTTSQNVFNFLMKPESNNHKNIIYFFSLNKCKKIFIENIFFYNNFLLGTGSFSHVFLGGRKNDDEVLAIKVINRDDHNDLDFYLEEKDILISLRNKGNFPNIYDWNYDNKYIYMAESVMGPSLNELVGICDNEIDLLSLFNVAIDLFNQIKIIHDNNILHRDLKRSNICYGNFSNAGKKYIRNIGFLDFGNSKMYKVDNRISKVNYNNTSPCTREYSSIDVLKGVSFSRKDNLESLIYLLRKLYLKKYPWENIDYLISNRIKNIDNLNKIKNDFPQGKIESSDLFEIIRNKNKNNERLEINEILFVYEYFKKEEILLGMPKEFLEIYKIIRNMKYIEKPNYERIINILKEGKIKILKEYFQNNKFFEKYNGKIIQFNFIWEKILFDYALYDKAPKNKNFK